MKRTYHTANSGKTSQKGAPQTGGSFCFTMPYGNGTDGSGGNDGEKKVGKSLPAGNYRAKLASASFRTARSGLAVSKKIILTALRYFSRKPCLSESVCRQALVVQRAAKARILTIKTKRTMNQAFATSAPPAPMRMPVPASRRKKTVKPEPAIRLPPRGTAGAVHVSTLLDPVLKICRHPERDRLLAEFFNR